MFCSALEWCCKDLESLSTFHIRCRYGIIFDSLTYTNSFILANREIKRIELEGFTWTNDHRGHSHQLSLLKYLNGKKDMKSLWNVVELIETIRKNYAWEFLEKVEGFGSDFKRHWEA